MNQILITQNDKPNKENKKKTKNEPMGIKSIVKVFAVLILLFGLALSGNGAYAIVKNMQEQKNSKSPIVETLKNGNTVKISITCESGIRTISYAWNDSTPTIVQGRGKTQLEQTISIPTGENRLNLSVIDSNGKTSRYVKTLKQDEADVTEPTIEFEIINSNIKIIATDDVAIDYITYKYGDEEEVTINAQEEGQTTIEKIIPVTQGEKTLTIEAVDKAQNVATIDQKIKGAKKPTIEITPDPNDPAYLIIKAYDDDGLRLVSYFVNDQEYKTDPNISLNTKTFEWRQKVEPGESKITARVYNINEQVTEFEGIYNY